MRKVIPKSILLLFLALVFISSGFVQQRERQAEVQKTAGIDEDTIFQSKYLPQIDPAKAEIIEQAKYYRSIGENEKARELLSSLTSRPVQAASIDKGPDQITVTKEDPSEQKKEGVGILWDTTDNPVSTSVYHERYPFLEARYNAVNDNEIYHVCERWSGSTAPDKIRLTRSMNHGHAWYEAYALDSSSELSTPEIKQVGNYYMGVVFTRKFTDADYDIHFWRPKVTDFTEYSYTHPDNSGGTIDRGPHLETDYLDFGDGAYVYVIYNRVAGSNSEVRFVRSLDGGLSWEDSIHLCWVYQEPLDVNNNASISYETTNNTLWAAIVYPFSGNYRVRIYKSTDFGTTWTTPSSFDISYTVRSVSITAKSSNEAWVICNYDYWLAAQNTRIYYTSDGGYNFSYVILEGTPSDDSRYGRIRYTAGSSYIYAAYLNLADNGVYVYRASTSTPTTWTSLGNIKNSTNALTADPVALLVSQNPSGTLQGSVSWIHQFSSTDYDVYFDAEWLPLATATKMAVVPTTNFSSSGAQGGPFSPSAMDYLIENTGTQSVSYTVSVNQSWVSLSNTSGTLGGGNAATVTVSINSGANSLAPGTYTATVTFTNTTNGVGNTTRTVTLTVSSTAGWLSVTPGSGCYFCMFRGGPAPIPTGLYTLQNTGGTAINWQITKTKNWVSVSTPTSGTLNPSASTAKTISINTNSLTLTQGTYTDTLTFTNTTNGNGNTTRSVTLDVNYNMWITVRGTTNQIYQREMTTTGSLLSWRPLAGYTNKTPATATFINRCYIIVKSDINNDIWYNYVNPNTPRDMGTWTKLDGATPDKMAAAVFNDKLYIVVRGTDNKIYYRYMTTAGTWSSWSTVPGGYTNVPPAIAAFNNYLYLIVKDVTDNKIWWNKMNTAGTWSGWQLMDGMSPSTAAMTEFNGQLYIVVRGSDNRLYFRSMNTSELFTAWGALTGWTDDSPAICSFNNLLYLWVKGLGSNDIWYNNMTTGGAWGSWTKMDGASPVTASVVAPKID